LVDQVLKPGETTDRGEVGIIRRFCRIRAGGEGPFEEIERLARVCGRAGSVECSGHHTGGRVEGRR
jgi:hypothetical protein